MLITIGFVCVRRGNERKHTKKHQWILNKYISHDFPSWNYPKLTETRLVWHLKRSKRVLFIKRIIICSAYKSGRQGGQKGELKSSYKSIKGFFFKHLFPFVSSRTPFRSFKYLWHSLKCNWLELIHFFPHKGKKFILDKMVKASPVATSWNNWAHICPNNYGNGYCLISTAFSTQKLSEYRSNGIA